MSDSEGIFKFFFYKFFLYNTSDINANLGAWIVKRVSSAKKNWLLKTSIVSD